MDGRLGGITATCCVVAAVLGWVLSGQGLAWAAEEAAGSTGTTVPYGVLFESSWNTAVGASEEAVTDGGTWPKVGNREKGVFEVKKGGVADNNYMHFRISLFRRRQIGQWSGPWGGHWGGVWGPVKGMVESEHTYFRYYQRTYPHTDYRYGNGHFVQDFHYEVPGTNGSQNVFGGVQAVEGEHWRPYICSTRRTEDPEYKQYEYQFFTTGRTPDLDVNRWYRIEGHVRWLEHTRASRTVWDMRIYDDRGELIKTSRDWTPHYRGEHNLEEYFKSGRFIYAEGRDPTWFMCYNDPASLRLVREDANPKPGDGAPSHDFCALQIRNDRWCGPVEGDTTPDGEAPTVAVALPQDLQEFEEDPGEFLLKGTASDNTELYQVRWLREDGTTGMADGLVEWKASVPLNPGRNGFRVVAVDKYLNSAEAAVTVIRDAQGARIESAHAPGSDR